MRRVALTLTAMATTATIGLLLSGCGSPGTTGGSPAAPSVSVSGSPALSGTVNVFAAASLRKAFTTLGAQFEAEHPGTRVVLNFGASSGLATQITAGAPADVFASASTTNMEQVITAGAATSPKDFASNVMQIAVPPQNPANVTQLSDLAKPDVKVALCQMAVPCGVTAGEVFSRAKISVIPVTQEVDVKAVLTKVTLGEVDAGVVYVTDVRAAGARVKGIVIPADVNASTTYPIATLTKAPNKATAAAFTAYVLSADAASALRADGFGTP